MVVKKIPQVKTSLNIDNMDTFKYFYSFLGASLPERSQLFRYPIRMQR